MDVRQGVVDITETLNIQTRFGLVKGPNSDNGMDFAGTVTMPAGFAADGGQWHYVQKVTQVGRNATQDDVENTQWSNTMNGQSVLDTAWPYDPQPAGSWDTGPVAAAAAGYGITKDTVTVPLNSSIPGSQPPANPKQYVLNETFEMYIMFKPKGEDNRWVPLKVVSWWYSGQVTKGANGVWVVDWSNQDMGGVTDTSVHPTWTQNVAASHWES